jgi:hypothetical protein
MDRIHNRMCVATPSPVCCIAYICCRKKRQPPFPLLRKTRVAEFLDDAAEILILTVIFQPFAAKYCSRALFRHAVQNLPSRAPHVDARSAKKCRHFAVASPGMPVAKL